MHKRTAGLIVAGTLAVGGSAVALTPASAEESGNAVTSRLAGIKGALSGLVDDGTLTQKQADKVASTLDKELPSRGGKGHHGFGMLRDSGAAAAKALDLTVAELRTELKGGKTLADVATDKDVSVDTLVTAMVKAAKDDVAAAVKDGKLTQAQADKITSNLTERITDRVNGVRPERGGHRGDAGTPPADKDSSDAEPSIAS